MTPTPPLAGRPADRPAVPGSHIVVVAAGEMPARADLDAAWPGWDADIAGVIAADGGLAGCDALGLQATVLVGDLDSADPALVSLAEDAGLRVVRATADKDESDTELAVREAMRAGPSRVTVLGALGGPRLDHALANVWLLAHPALASTPASLLGADARVSLVTAPRPGGAAVVRALPGRVGAVVSLLPFAGDVEGVTTTGLLYPLRDEALVTGPARGLSNVRVDALASVTVRSGRLLLVEGAYGEIASRAAGLSSFP